MLHYQVIQKVSAESKKLCQFTICFPNRLSLQINTNVYVLPQLAGNVSSCPTPQQILRDLPKLPLADPKSYESAQLDILIGADVLLSILLSGSLLGKKNHFMMNPNRTSAPSQNLISDLSREFHTRLTHSWTKCLQRFGRWRNCQ